MKKLLFGVFVIVCVATSSFAGSNDIAKWKDLGLTNSRYIKEYVKKNITPTKYKQYLNILRKNHESDNDFDLKNRVYGWIVTNNITDVNVLKQWVNLSIYPDFAQEWIEAGIKNVNDVKGWRSFRISASYAKAYMEKGIDFKTYKECLSAFDIYKDDFVKWWLSNSPNSNKAKALEQFRFRTAHWLEPWVFRANITKPKELKQWIKAFGNDNYSWQDAKSWYEAGFKDAKVAAEWNSLGISPSNLEGVKLTIKELRKWKKIGIKSIYKIREWKEMGIDTPKKAALWLKVTEDTRFIKKLLAIGLTTPEKYQPYSHLYSLEHIQKLVKWNIKPNKLINSMSYVNNKIIGGGGEYTFFFHNKEHFIDAYNKLKKECSVINDKVYFAQEDPFENKGNCYVSMSKLEIKDSKNSGYFLGMSDRKYFYGIFSTKWKEKQTKATIVKGLGVYKYKTKNNRIITTNKGKFIYEVY